MRLLLPGSSMPTRKKKTLKFFWKIFKEIERERKEKVKQNRSQGFVFVENREFFVLYEL